eukprot:3466788-Rhodomonas_salina.1
MRARREEGKQCNRSWMITPDPRESESRSGTGPRRLKNCEGNTTRTQDATLSCATRVEAHLEKLLVSELRVGVDPFLLRARACHLKPMRHATAIGRQRTPHLLGRSRHRERGEVFPRRKDLDRLRYAIWILVLRKSIPHISTGLGSTVPTSVPQSEPDSVAPNATSAQDLETPYPTPSVQQDTRGDIAAR